MNVFKRLASNAVFGIQVLIVFLLFFETRLEIPTVLKSIGRMHLVMLHFPIALFVLTAFLVFARRWFESGSYSALVSFLLHVTSLVASLTAVMGLFLSYEGGYDTESLSIHKWLGLTLSFFCWILLMVSEDRFAFKPLMALGFVLLVLTGHFGANLTHGEDYLFAPLAKNELKKRIITDSTTIFEAAVEPIFESRCYGCHNEQKAKGKLILTSFESARKGGKNGTLWKDGDANHSMIIKRLELPLGHKEHMPPQDKGQLTADEINFIRMWIDRGADSKRTLRAFGREDSLAVSARQIASRYISSAGYASPYPFQFVSADQIASLNSPTRSVFQLSTTDPALHAEFYLSSSFKKEELDELIKVKEQIVSINLSKMPVADEDLATLGRFVNLEKLVLNNTQINGSGLKHLQPLKHLRSLSLSGTKVTASSLQNLGQIPALREIYVWNTSITDSELNDIRERFPAIDLDSGFHPDEKEVLQLSPPFVRNDGQVLNNDEGIIFKHNLPGTTIRWALNDEEIDSISGEMYREPIRFSSYAVAKIKAFKDGWRSSKQNELVFFKKGFKPLRGELRTTPNKRYPGEGIQTLIDGKKGMPDFYRDPVWMAFREEPLEAVFYFDNSQPPIKNITLSFAKNTYAMCMPPAEVEIWGGNEEKQLKLIKTVKPSQPTEHASTRIEGISIDLPDNNYRTLKFVAKPLAKLPAFRKAPKESGWLMIDEVFFN